MSTLQKELTRKLVHLFQLPIIFGYTLILSYFSQRTALLSLTGLLLLLLEAEYFRVDYTTDIGNRFTKFFSNVFLRRHEKDRVVSAVFFVISAIISFSVFDYPIALCALLLSTFGDLAAAIFGTAIGGPKIFRNKTFVGSAAGLIVNLGVAYYILNGNLVLATVMALTGSVVEMLTQKLDDNLTVPLFSGFVGQMFIIFMQ